MFLVNKEIEIQSLKLIECISVKHPDFFKTAMSQYAFESDVLSASITHVDRTYNEKAATMHLLPFLPFISSFVKLCDGKTHEYRLKTLLRVVQNIPVNVPIVMTCTCVMQSRIFGKYMDKLHKFSNIVQLSKSTRPYPLSISKNVIVVPYFSNQQASASCHQKDRLIYWRGSPNVANRNASRVRHHIMEFAKNRGFEVVASTRGKCSENSSLCINGFGAGRDQHAKSVMREEMRKHEFCFVPEGDSPESSRLADAINALCIPVVISKRIAVSYTEIWNDSVVVIEPNEFLHMNARDVLKRIHATNISCNIRQRLRHETSANMILHRLREFVNKSFYSHVHSTIG